MQIRRAELKDIEALLPQFEAYRSFYKRDAAPEKAREFLTENLATERSVVFIAQSESGEVIGFTQLYPRVSSLSMAPYIYISDLFVNPKVRRQGVARRLMDVVREFSIAGGARNVQLETAHTNKSAQALYESLGYEYEKDYRTYVLGLQQSAPVVVVTPSPLTVH